jgi:hypothetical protein
MIALDELAPGYALFRDAVKGHRPGLFTTAFPKPGASSRSCSGAPTSGFVEGVLARQSAELDSASGHWHVAA